MIIFFDPFVTGKRHGKGEALIYAATYTVGDSTAQHGHYSGAWKHNMRFVPERGLYTRNGRPRGEGGGQGSLAETIKYLEKRKNMEVISFPDITAVSLLRDIDTNILTTCHKTNPGTTSI